MDVPTPFERLGGEPVLRRIVERLVQRMTTDVMIGFHFDRVDRRRLVEKEYEHAAAWLGAPVTYGGRPLREAHAAHPILGGHFMRRLRLLDEVLLEAGVADDLRQAWLDHTLSLRAEITPLEGEQCHAPGDPVHPAVARRGA